MAPATEALLVSHGQPSDPVPAEDEIARLAASVAGHLPGWRVRGTTLALPGALETALAEAALPPVIYPLFMSDGWFTSNALPTRLNGRQAQILPPLGMDTDLPGLAAESIAGHAAGRGWPLASVTLVLAAHGSGRSRKPAQVAADFAAEIARQIPLDAIHVGFVEESPTISKAAAGAGSRSVCLPFFASAGGHVIEDIPRELDVAGFTGDVLTPVGMLPGIPALIARSIANAQSSFTQAGWLRPTGSDANW